MSALKKLEREIAGIKKRNRLVEGDKAWETSWMRKGLIAGFTYIALGGYLFYIGIPDAHLHAIVPTVGFVLSTLTFPFFKKVWLKHVFYRSKR